MWMTEYESKHFAFLHLVSAEFSFFSYKPIELSVGQSDQF
jgi:hypothetical protein